MGNLLNALITDISVGGNRLFHCGDSRLRKNKLFHWRDEKELGRLSNAELVSASLSELIDNCPSPREEGVGERVHSFIKIKILKLIQEINFNISLQKEFIGVPQIK